MSTHVSNNIRPAPDQILVDIAEYVENYNVTSQEAYQTARYCLIDSLGCALESLSYPACTKLLGPAVPEITVTNGVKIPGTSFELDPITAAFNIGTMIRWLDFNDTWLAAEWGHPSDNLGAILAIADYVSRRGRKLSMHDVLTAMVKAYEIQGILALQNSFNKIGLDHVILVKVASTAIAAKLLGANHAQIVNALSQAWIDGHPLRTYRHTPNTGSRKSWAAGDATSRAVQLALISLKGEMGYPSALSAKTWGFYDVLFKGKPLTVDRAFASYVIENILFKISFPAEFHAQTAVECAIALHPIIKDRFDKIEKIVLTTHESALRIIDKIGLLDNPADRDHCLQYMVAIGLLFGDLTAAHYEDKVAADPRIDILRLKMTTIEDKNYSKDYLDPSKRSIANAIQIYFKDGSHTKKIEIEYPIGHRRRREEGIPLLEKKFQANLGRCFSQQQQNKILDICSDQTKLEKMPVDQFMDLFVLH